MRKKGENFESYLRRHNKKLIASGLVKSHRKRQFRIDPINKVRRKKQALFGRKLASRRDFLIKIGKLKEDLTRNRW